MSRLKGTHILRSEFPKSSKGPPREIPLKEARVIIIAASKEAAHKSCTRKVPKLHTNSQSKSFLRLLDGATRIVVTVTSTDRLVLSDDCCFVEEVSD